MRSVSGRKRACDQNGPDHPGGVVRLGKLASGRGTLRPMDTHAAVGMLTAAGADEALAVAVADVGGRRR